MSEDDISPIEWIVLGVLFLAGATMFVNPAAVTMGLFIDFLDAFPEPSVLGPYGNLIAAISMALGGGGLLQKKFL